MQHFVPVLYEYINVGILTQQIKQIQFIEILYI